MESAGSQPGQSPASNPNGKASSSTTYVSLLRNLILTSKDQALTLTEIYDQMERDHPDISANRPGWKNTTRHCLSMQPCFQLKEKPFPQPGRGGYWTVDLTAPDTYPRNRSRKKKQARSTSPSSSTQAAVPGPPKKARRSNTLNGDTNATASSSRSADSQFSDGEDGYANGPPASYPPVLLDLGRRDSPHENGYRPDGNRPAQHPSWAPLHQNPPPNAYDSRLLSERPSSTSSYPSYGFNPAHTFPTSSSTLPYLAQPYGTLSSYQQQPQQPFPTFPAPDRSQQRPSNVYGQQSMYPPSSYQPQPRASHPSQQPQPFYPSYHPPPFASTDTRAPSVAATSNHPGSHAGYNHLSPMLPASSPVTAASSQQLQQHQPSFYGHQPRPELTPQARPRSPPGPDAQQDPELQRPSSPASHPLHLTSLMNAPATATATKGLVQGVDGVGGGGGRLDQVDGPKTDGQRD